MKGLFSEILGIRLNSCLRKIFLIHLVVISIGIQMGTNVNMTSMEICFLT